MNRYADALNYQPMNLENNDPSDPLVHPPIWVDFDGHRVWMDGYGRFTTNRRDSIVTAPLGSQDGVLWVVWRLESDCRYGPLRAFSRWADSVAYALWAAREVQQ